VNPKGKILLADRNRHVRKYLERELSSEGYQVILAGEGRELLQLFACQDPPDVLVLDPDIPCYLTIPELLKLLHFQHPAVPIVIHTFLPEDDNYAEMPEVAICVEKGEDVSLLKKLIADLLHKHYHSYQASQL
jgi:CheY-like chemotaxis protein